MTKFGKVENAPSIADQMDYAPSIEMGIKNAPTQLIVKYLTDMYTYPLEAAIRETVSNAIDASTRAGGDANGVKFGFSSDVTTFGDEARETFKGLYDQTGHDWFIVRDNGEGMDSDTLTNVYTQYGMSDKRGESSTTGAFGLGAKSPLAYCDEFHVVTKTKDGLCRYIACYRTVTGDLVADSPRIVNGELEFTIKRNWEKRLIIPQGMAINGTFDNATRVNDIFCDSTGTIVAFPIRSENVDKARAIAAGIDNLLRGINGACCYDHVHNDRTAYIFREIARAEIHDDNGTQVTATAYYTRREIQIADQPDINSLAIWANGGFPDFSIGFKVGDWFYSQDNSAWRVDDNTNIMCNLSDIIIDIPSTALSFVPSRDTILENDNTRVIVSAIRNEIKKNIMDPKWLGSFINWLANQHNVKYNSFKPFDFAKSGGGIHNKVFYPSVKNGDEYVTIEINPSSFELNVAKFSVDVDLREIYGISGRSYHDMLSEESAMTLLINAPRGLGKGVIGPVVSSPDKVAWLGSVGRMYESYGDKKITAISVTKAKTAADGLIRGKQHLTNCCINTREQVAATANVPLGFVINALPCLNAYRSRPEEYAAIIIDASETKLSRVRGSAMRIANNSFKNEELPASINSIALIAVPASVNEDAEKAELIIERAKNDLENLGVGKIKVIKKNELETYMKNDTELETRELGEIRKLFCNAAITTNVRGGACYTTAKNVNVLLQNAKKSFIVAVPDEEYERSQKLGHEIAYKLSMIYGDNFPEHNYIISIAARHYKKERIDLAKRLGFKVLLNKIDKNDTDVVYDSNIISTRAKELKSRCGANYDFVYNGAMNDDMVAYLENKYMQQYKDDVRAALSTLFSGSFTPYGSKNLNSEDVKNIVSGVTYGRYEYRNFNSNNSKALESIYENVLFENYDGTEVREALEKEAKSINDICRIWHEVMKENGLIINPCYANIKTRRSSGYVSFIRGIGEYVGLDSIIEAYSSGVPISDILATME